MEPIRTAVIAFTRYLFIPALVAYVVATTYVHNIEWDEMHPYPSPTREAMAKCAPVPANTFPTHAVVQYNDTVYPTVEYTDAKWLVDYLFDVSVGEMPPLSTVEKFTLCR